MASTSSIGDVGASGTNPQTNIGCMECFCLVESMELQFLAGKKNGKGDDKLVGALLVGFARPIPP